MSSLYAKRFEAVGFGHSRNLVLSTHQYEEKTVKCSRFNLEKQAFCQESSLFSSNLHSAHQNRVRSKFSIHTD